MCCILFQRITSYSTIDARRFQYDRYGRPEAIENLESYFSNIKDLHITYGYTSTDEVKLNEKSLPMRSENDSIYITISE